MSGARFRAEVKLTFAPGTMWGEAVRRAAPMARQYRDDRVAAGTFPNVSDTLVGGREGDVEENVKPGELIVYRARVMGLAIQLAFDELRARAPVGGGKKSGAAVGYRNSFMVSIRRGAGWEDPVSFATFNPATLDAAVRSAVVFSPLPYSRKVDVQMVGTRKIRVSVPAEFFAATARIVAAGFRFLEVSRLYTVPLGVPFQRDRAEGRRGKGSGAVIQYPAIIIESRDRR